MIQWCIIALPVKAKAQKRRERQEVMHKSIYKGHFVNTKYLKDST